MTHQSHQTNGASLEDCHTNFFALTDLCGIKWRRVALGESHYAPEPLEDPVLSSFSRCLAGDILCVWRRVASPAPGAPLSGNTADPNSSANGGGLFDMVGPGLGPIGNAPVTHPPLSLCAAKELWIFWYGEEPNLSGILAPELMAAETQNGCWESGLSYECRSLLFKALHNLIERCLLSRDFVRLGKWFVQPYSSSERQLGKSTAHLSFSFAFFVHGESTVCASVDVRQHPPVRCLKRHHIVSSTPDQPPRQVILAPFGMAGTLTGQSGRAMDTATSRLLEEWRHFYPITPRENSDPSLPQAVEVLVGGVKMRYPSCYVLVTDMDEAKSSNSGITNLPINSKNSVQPAAGQPNQPSIMTPPPSPVSYCGLGPSLTPHGPPSLTLPPTPAVFVPERVWQDCIMNPEYTSQNQSLQDGSSFPMQVDQSKQSENSQNNGSSNNMNLNSTNSSNSSSNSFNNTSTQWDFTDPTNKVNCSCSKCRKYIGGRLTGRSSGVNKTSSSSQQNNTNNTIANSRSGAGTGRVPFHRRSPLPKTETWRTCIKTKSNSAPRPSEESSPSQTPPSYSRVSTQQQSNANTSSENLGVLSVGSAGAPSPMMNANSVPGIANPSPLDGNAGGSTPRPPSSVPPCDALMPVLSPQPPTSVLEKSNNTPTGQSTDAAVASTPETHEQNDTNGALLNEPNAQQNATGGPKSVSSIGGNLLSSPYVAPPESVEVPQAPDAATTNGLPNMGILKRPVLVSREYESALHDNEHTLDMLYDYSTMDAWLNHPVKRFKPSEVKKETKLGRGIHLYAGHTPVSSAPDPPVAMNILVKQEIKQENIEKDCNKINARNLYTNEGLQVSSNDLDELFDNSDDASGDEVLQVHTPPGSNKSSGCIDDQKRCSSGNNMNTGIVRAEELSKMFPTPPSLEHNLVASPCGGALTDFMTDLDMPKYKQEIYPNMGSPQQENIEDWSYVFKPPTICKYVGSSKYAPLNSLPSQLLPVVTLPPNCVYKPKPTWQQSNSNNISSSDKSVTPISAACHTMIPPGPSSAPRSSSVSSVNMGPGMSHRPGLSPISPVNHFPPSPMHNNLNMHMNPFRPGGPSVRTPIPPPPPYEMPSPASTASSYLNKNFPSVEATTPCTLSRPPEANSLMVNILLGDTALNLFRDHNFDSCTLCVCNAGPKMVGNIRGADAGIYLAPPCSNKTTLAPLPSVSPFTNNGTCGPPPYGMLASPATPHHTSAAAVNGYVDDDPIRCSCGFSAVVNRRLAHQAGLFYEDEMEITGLADDPSENKKVSLLSSLLSSAKTESSLDHSAIDVIPHSVMDLLRDQCIVIQSSSRSLHRAACRYQRANTTSISNMLNALEFMDGNDLTSLALDQGRQATLDNTNICKLEDRTPRINNTASVHRWPFIRAAGPDCNQDIIRVMNSLRPLLQEAIQKKCPTRLWEAPYTISGPLTWRQFHRLAGRGTDDMCEPQPIPSLVVGHEKDWLSLSPYAIQYWDKLLLEPYSYTRDVSYIVMAPDNDAVVSKVRTFFKELSTTYEMCKLGRHVPLNKVLKDGILRVCNNSKLLSGEPIDDWFTVLGDSKVADMLKSYAKVCKQNLMPLLNDKTLLEPESNCTIKDRPMPSPMPPPSTPDPSQGIEKAPSTPKHDQEPDAKESTSSMSNNTADVVIVSTHEEDEVLPPSLIIYLVEPFTTGSDNPDLERLACLALLRCFCAVLAGIPESVRNNISVQIISQDSIMELGRCRDSIKMSDHMRSLALSVFMQCRRHLIHTNNIKSLTGFGTAANAELFLKSKDEKNRAPYKLYTPPYILAPHKEKGDGEGFRLSTAEQQCSVMYLNYCLSEDQSWLLAVATDERGEFLETITINIDVPNRKRRKKASARRVALEKLMDFILGVMSQSTQPWRLVVGRIGRIGHGELKGWSWLLSRKNLLKASKHLKEICGQCSLLYQFGAVPSILSACLVSLEPDSVLRLMADQFTPDERFSQASVNSPLSTPQDVTCTHILVFPTSATTQSSQTTFQESHMNDIDDEFMIEDMDEEMTEGLDPSFNDIFNTWPEPGAEGLPSPSGSPKHEESGPVSPGAICDHDQQSMFPDGLNNMGGVCSADTIEEVGTVLQQPLALGYLVSTAPTGKMPKWFWAPCPHLENVCPVFLKNALHLHSPAVHQKTDDIVLQRSPVGGHPLDSQLTTDVLRYVLEGYNALSWLAMDTNTHDRLSCLPAHVQVLMQLYHLTAALV